MPAADEVWRLQRDDDPECRFFRRAIRGGDGPSAGSMQGTYVLAASGLLLAQRNSNDPRAIAEILEVLLARLDSEVVAVAGDAVELRIDGTTSAIADGEWRYPADNYWRPRRTWPRTLTSELAGTATWDRARGRFVAFEVVALGQRTGRTAHNGRRDADRAGRIGFVLQLAPAGWRVAPTFVNVYAADWVAQPTVPR